MTRNGKHAKTLDVEFLLLLKEIITYSILNNFLEIEKLWFHKISFNKIERLNY